MAPSTPTRRPYHGSCHCGHTRYICYLTLPPRDHSANASIDNTRIRKCNCTACHKTAHFSVRLADAPNDFVLLSPSDPFKELSDYTTGRATAHWFFCPNCGVRCFLFGYDEANGESADIDLDVWLGRESKGEKTRVWKPKKQGWDESWQTDHGTYLSVYATSLDAGQEGLDLREWHEKGWIVYFDYLNGKGDDVNGMPHPGGTY